MKTFVVGLDLSLTGTGVVVLDAPAKPGTMARLHHTELIKVKGGDHRIYRVATIADYVNQQVERLAKRRRVHVFVEGYSFNSAQRSHHLGELGGVVRLFILGLKKTGVELHPDVPPATWRKYLLGKNPPKGAKKAAHDVLAKVLEGHDMNGDQLDAYGVANFGVASLGLTGVSVG